LLLIFCRGLYFPNPSTASRTDPMLGDTVIETPLLRREAKIIFYSYVVDMTFLASQCLERNNVWGPTDRPRSTDRCMFGNGRRWSTWLRDAEASFEERNVCVHVCVCVCVPVQAHGMSEGARCEEERRTGMKAKESGTSAGTTGCKMLPSLCTHLHTAFHVCVTTCEIQATLSFLPTSLYLRSRIHPRARTTYLVRDVPHFVRISLKFAKVTREIRCSLLQKLPELQIGLYLFWHIKFYILIYIVTFDLYH